MFPTEAKAFWCVNFQKLYKIKIVKHGNLLQISLLLVFKKIKMKIVSKFDDSMSNYLTYNLTSNKYNLTRCQIFDTESWIFDINSRIFDTNSGLFDVTKSGVKYLLTMSNIIILLKYFKKINLSKE